MCGIVGKINLGTERPLYESEVRQMLATIRHRGPDEFGIYIDPHAALGSARLSIIDLSSGQQPMSNEDGSLWIVFNGEIFNYIELREELLERGHQFSTSSDTEVILHLFEDFGPDCLRLLNGQFAFAIWDNTNRSLFLARDRLGIRPVYYTLADSRFIFGSEIKAIFTDLSVHRELEPYSLNDIFTYWGSLSPKTVFKDIYELEAGHFLKISDGLISTHQYWDLEFPVDQRHSSGVSGSSTLDKTEAVSQLKELLVDSTKIRLRADVPVGAYLSGGLDSSTIAAIIRNYTSNKLDTFSISFEDPDFDESAFQIQMAEFLGTNHQVIRAQDKDIGEVFPDVIWHTETPIMRTSPAPLFLLSKLVREHDYKVVLTGEGADEFFAGYNIFKEMAVRRFWARQPESEWRPSLLSKLYPYIANLSSGNDQFLRAFFGRGLTDTQNPAYSHAVRWGNNARCTRFFSNELKVEIQRQTMTGQKGLSYPPLFDKWHPLSQAQYNEIRIFLSQYLLSSQGDRVMMANSVEGRFPFLDYRVTEFANQLRPDLKLYGLTEKYLIRQLASEWLPEEIWTRPKRPYRSPIRASFFGEGHSTYVEDLLAKEYLEAAGYFNPDAVAKLANKARTSDQIGETDEMAIVGIISTQLVHNQFISNFVMPPPIASSERIKIVQFEGISHS